jgi:hypothetical protein
VQLEVGDGLESHAQTESEIRITVCSLIIMACSYTFGVSGGFMHPFITLSVLTLSGSISVASFFGPFLGAGMVLLIMWLFSLCKRSRSREDLHRVPMIMKRRRGRLMLDSETRKN